MLTVTAVILIILAFLNILFGVLVFLGSRRTQLTGLFMVFNCAVGLWSLGIGLFYLTNSEVAALWYVRLYYVAAALIAYSLVLFMTAYTKNKLAWPQVASAAIPFTVVVYSIFAPNGLINGLALTPQPSVILNQPVYIFYVVYFLAYFTIAILIAWRAYVHMRRRGAQADRRSMFYVVVSILLSGIFGMIFNLILPLLGNYELIWIGPLGSLLMVLLVFVAVTRHSLFDIKRAMFSVLGYLLTALSVAAVASFVLMFWNGISTGSWRLETDQYTATLVALAVVALGYRPLKMFIERISEDIFFKQTYDIQIELRRLGDIILSEPELEKLLEKTVVLLTEVVNPSELTIIACDQKLRPVVSIGKKLSSKVLTEYLTSTQDVTPGQHGNDQVVVRFQTASQTIGCLVLGKKQTGGFYQDKDIRFLQLVSAELSIAIQNGLRYYEIKNFNDTLRTRVEEATAELQHTNKRLKQLDQTKDEFISLTSHQLRTPLTTIKGYISMLLDGDAGKITPQQRKLLEEAFDSSQRMVHIIGDFLNLSRVQTGKFQIELSDVNLADILNEEIDQLRTSAVSRGLKLAYDKPAHFPVIACDEGKIRQVMMNFIDNAIYYSPPNTTIDVTLVASPQKVEFKVIDRGIGVPKDEQHKLFAKFSRASNAKKQRPDGTGIGLFMAKKVIVALGGAIIFQSKENQGSTFGFRLNVPKTTR